MNSVDTATIEQDAFRQGRFARVDVGANPYIPHFIDRNSHGKNLSVQIAR
jgi:hypothetical protein